MHEMPCETIVYHSNEIKVLANTISKFLVAYYIVTSASDWLRSQNVFV